MDSAQGNQNLYQELVELGFDDSAIKKALALTQNKDQAIELILSFQEELPAAVQQPKPDKTQQQQQQQQLPQQQQQQQQNLDQNAINLLQNLSNLTVEQLLNVPGGEEAEDIEEQKRYKMVIVVRADLKMGVGKIGAQVGHGGSYQRAEEVIQKNEKGAQELEEALDIWDESGAAKIVVRVDSEQELLQLHQRVEAAGINNYLVVDQGRTQVQPNTTTVLAIGPAEESVINEFTRHLKLL